jgi:hypothetical protein
MIPVIKNGFRDFLRYLGADRLSIRKENFSTQKAANYFNKIARDLS